MNLQTTAVTARTPVYDAMKLTGGGASAVIVLEGQIYTLRITKAGKLVLNK